MDQAGLRGELLQSTVLWLMTDVVSFLIMFFFIHFANVSDASGLAFANLTSCFLLVPLDSFRRINRWLRFPLYLCVLLIIILPWLLLIWLMPSVLQTLLFLGGWFYMPGVVSSARFPIAPPFSLRRQRRAPQ